MHTGCDSQISDLPLGSVDQPFIRVPAATGMLRLVKLVNEIKFIQSFSITYYLGRHHCRFVGGRLVDWTIVYIDENSSLLAFGLIHLASFLVDGASFVDA